MPNRRELEQLLANGCGQCDFQIVDPELCRMLGVRAGYCEVRKEHCPYGGDKVSCDRAGGGGVFGDFCGKVNPDSPFLKR